MDGDAAERCEDEGGHIFNHGLHGFTRMIVVGFILCRIGIDRVERVECVEHKDFGEGVVG